MLSGERKREIDQEGRTGRGTAIPGEETLRNKSEGQGGGASGSVVSHDQRLKGNHWQCWGPTVCPALGEHFGLIVPLSLHTTCIPGPITLLVCSGCCNKVSLTGWLINNRHLLLAVLEARSPSLAGCQHGHVLLRAHFWVADSCLCMVTSHGEDSELALWSSFEDTNPIHEGSTLRT